MAGDWIKMRTDLYRNPKICVIADLLISPDSELSRFVSQNMQRDMSITRNVMRNVTVGALVSVWGILRHRGKRNGSDLVIDGCTLSVIDDIADLNGFGEALSVVGWAEETDNGIVLPRFFEEMNVDPEEEAKAKNAERQRRYREKQSQKNNVTQDVTVASQSNSREEKRREEVNLKPLSVKREEITESVLGTDDRPLPSRKGIVCGLLRKAGMADAAPHYLTEDAWEAILAKRTDEEIVELARAKMAANPGRRIGLKYIAPALLEDPQRIEANARDSPAGRRKTLTETRTATIAGLTGGRTTTPKEQQRESIESTAVRIAG